MKPLNLILDFTETCKKRRQTIDKCCEETGIVPYVPFSIIDTFLTLEYPNGEHAATFPEVRTPEAGRKAAKTFMKYCDCVFTDKTKE